MSEGGTGKRARCFWTDAHPSSLSIPHHRLTGENEALVREHLKATREQLVAQDEADVKAFLASQIVGSGVTWHPA